MRLYSLDFHIPQVFEINFRKLVCYDGSFFDLKGYIKRHEYYSSQAPHNRWYWRCPHRRCRYLWLDSGGLELTFL